MIQRRMGPYGAESIPPPPPHRNSFQLLLRASPPTRRPPPRRHLFLHLCAAAFSSFFCTVSFHLRRAETPIGYIRSDLLPWWFQPRHEHCRRLTVNDPPRFFSLSFRSALFIPDTRSSFVTDRAGRLFDSTRRKRFRHESEREKKKNYSRWTGDT